MTDEAQYTFVPWVREGVQPLDDDEPDTATVKLTVEGESSDGDTEEESDEVYLTLYGPGEVTGVDRRQVIRTEPTPRTSDFPPNHFPVVEFDRPDLPWLFTPESEGEDEERRPWLCLVTVERTEGVSVRTGTDTPASVLDIQGPADPGDQLPDLAGSWAWAHAQVVGADDVGDELQTDLSEKTLSRLVSPRGLEPETDYYACLVPTFEPGRLAGLGMEPFEQDEDGNDVREYEDAWNGGESAVRLPVYHHWQFSTGPAGDFEALVRRLDPAYLEDVGIRQLDAGDPGPPALEAPGEVVSIEGALRSVDLDVDEYDDDLQENLVDLLDEASALAPREAVPDEPIEERVLGPPSYGQWPPAEPSIPDPDGTPAWLRAVNADPRYRAPAAFGTEVVQEEQENLMTEAWRQVGDIRETNKLLRRARLARGASQQIHDPLRDLDDEALLTVTEPAHHRLLDESAGKTVAATIAGSSFPEALLSPAFRRATRPGGPLSRRLGGIRREDVVEAVDADQYDPGDDGEPPESSATVDAKLLPNLCADAKARGRSVEAWNVLGEAGELGAAYVDEVRKRCHELRERLRLARHELDGHDQATRPLETMHEVLIPVCGHEDSNRLLRKLKPALEAGDWEAVDDLLGKIFHYLEQAGREHRRLRVIAQVDADVRYVLEKHPGVTPAWQAFREALALLTLAALVQGLAEATCQRAHEALRQIAAKVSGTHQHVERLAVACERLCGNPDDRKSLVALFVDVAKDGGPRRVRQVVTAVLELLRAARESLDVLEKGLDKQSAAAYQALVDACESLSLYFGLFRERLDDAPGDPLADAIARRACPRPTPEDPPLDLAATAETVRTATKPADTIPARIGARVGGLDIDSRDDPLDQILAHPEFDRPMYAPLRDRSQEYLVPGADEIPLDSVGVLETNPPFVEAYLLGANHEMARELRWREYPTDLRGTYFRQFWDSSGRDPPLTGDEAKDVDYVHKWKRDYPLGRNNAEKMAQKGKDVEDGDESGNGGNGDDGDEEPESQIVLVVRGALFDRYPNTIVYAAEGNPTPDGEVLREPDLPDPSGDEEGSATHPIFRGTLEPDVTFFGFDLTEDDVRSDEDDEDDAGWYFVLEEPPSEPSFGLDEPVEGDEDDDAPSWEDLAWDDVSVTNGYVDGHVATADDFDDDAVGEPHEWQHNGAHTGAITWIRPFRAAIHAEDMLENGGSQ